MIRVAVLTVFFIYCSAVYAHQDTIFRVKEGGEIHGLPEQYSPSTFEINTWTLSIGENSFVLPECITKNFEGLTERDVHLFGSWYHPKFVFDEEDIRLPNYLVFSVKSQSYEVIINLDTVKPFKFDDPKYSELTDDEICNSQNNT